MKRFLVCFVLGWLMVLGINRSTFGVVKSFESYRSSHSPAPEWNSGLIERSPLKGTESRIASLQSVSTDFALLAPNSIPGRVKNASEETDYISQSFSNAQTLDSQAQQFLERGDAESALKSWQQAEILYRKIDRRTEALGTQLNQAKTLQTLGAFRRAKLLLMEIQTSLMQQPNTALKVNGLLTLGNILRLVGEFKQSQAVLEQSLAISTEPADIQSAQFHIGNTLLAQQQLEAALDRFQQAAKQSGHVQIPAQLRQIKLLLQLDRHSEAEKLLPAIRSNLESLPLKSSTIYARIEFAECLAKFTPTSAVEQFAIAIHQSQKLSNPRTESYAIGRLAHLYEQTKQWQEAQQLTQRALKISEQINAPDILYQWQWQSGRLWNKLGDRQSATIAYTDAVKTLESLRNDLVSISSEVQFSFREQVEPVYREFVDLLLQQSSEANLIQARQVIESLQLEELNNFFREACLTAVARQIDQVDRTAAIFYPIILHDRLEVIVSLPNQSLKHYSTTLPRAEIESSIDRMIQSMRSTSFESERLTIARKLYRWLIQPVAKDLESVQTLVFVLDGSLRKVPIAALHTGEQYLVEKYAIAVTPSLELFSPRPLPRENLTALVAGLSEANQGAVALPGVQQEVIQIANKVSATVLKNQAFTNQALKEKLKTNPFSIVHLATHGQFSSSAENTYIQTWNGRLNVDDLRSLLTQRDVPDSLPIELLVLSACQTAEGDDRAALGIAGVAIRSGARSTLASLWMVNDRSTASFVTQFYQGLIRDRLSRAEAVRQAQLALLKTPEYNHPYYWAAFTLIGNWL
ncbi:CHAT domain-containing protein [Leptolyngbya sp. NIES-2104]|uniref:CHAT domain-containing protein n=1 Tax=Leptolyngbya sp. NIES-2104 TaxID=1552121 RepID=UPI0006EC4637|nr:CHAT domain-containing protein [Leptolyngbya sp. NIES-2104]GAP98751.1 putative hemagglutinin-related protein [Leptolyngbya sp. NIES-2104]